MRIFLAEFSREKINSGHFKDNEVQLSTAIITFWRKDSRSVPRINSSYSKKTGKTVSFLGSKNT